MRQLSTKYCYPVPIRPPAARRPPQQRPFYVDSPTSSSAILGPTDPFALRYDIVHDACSLAASCCLLPWAATTPYLNAVSAVSTTFRSLHPKFQDKPLLLLNTTAHNGRHRGGLLGESWNGQRHRRRLPLQRLRRGMLFYST